MVSFYRKKKLFDSFILWRHRSAVWHLSSPPVSHFVLSVHAEMFNHFCVLIAFISSTHSRSFGVSNVACQNMTPIHANNVPQDTMARVQIIPHAIKVKRGQQIKISLRSVESNYTFRGFFIQARGPADRILGHFLAQDNTKIIPCSDSYSTATHSDPSLKASLLLVWKAPIDYRGGFRFQWE